MKITKEIVLEALRNVEDPDLKKDIVTLGMVQDIVIDGKNISFSVVLTTPACPLKELIKRNCVNAIANFVDKDAVAHVNMTSNVTSQRSGLELQGIKNFIVVASGKGGVGKSTVAANLACALVAEINQAVVRRGPIAVRALNQMLSQTIWGELDYMIVDLPPGTGDIHLSLVEAIPVTGAVIVSTPQNVALADAKKAVAMFKLPSINIPILGIVENMAYFTPAELPENKYYIFGREGAKQLAEDLDVPLLGEIPLVQSICESGDVGRPVVLQETTPQAKAFLEMAGNVAQQVAIVNSKPKAVAAEVAEKNN
ncbi:MAG: P-loop NTPase [Bacteroidetes bacterium]|nr:P-loop NTPase [Bacteroidota bacterium]